MDDAHGFDGVRGIGGEAGFDRRGIGAVTPVAGDEFGFEAEAQREVFP